MTDTITLEGIVYTGENYMSNCPQTTLEFPTETKNIIWKLNAFCGKMRTLISNSLHEKVSFKGETVNGISITLYCNGHLMYCTNDEKLSPATLQKNTIEAVANDLVYQMKLKLSFDILCIISR